MYFICDFSGTSVDLIKLGKYPLRLCEEFNNPTARFWSSSVDLAEATRWPFVSSLDCRNILSWTYRILLLLSCSEYQFKDEIKITTSTHDIYRRILRKLFQGLLSDSKKCAISHDYLFLNSWKIDACAFE